MRKENINLQLFQTRTEKISLALYIVAYCIYKLYLGTSTGFFIYSLVMQQSKLVPKHGSGHAL